MLFEAALRRVVGEVDSLHVLFVEGSDGPRQVVEPLSEWLMPVVDVSEEPVWVRRICSASAIASVEGGWRCLR